ncbi:hypothetical protein RFI_33415, partial [Reticulomyxa filosa]
MKHPLLFCPNEQMYLRLQVVQKIFVQLVGAVKWLHTKKICHLDLSLENILIRNDDIFDPQVQIIDFGVSVDFSQCSSGDDNNNYDNDDNYGDNDNDDDSRRTQRCAFNKKWRHEHYISIT